MLSKLGLRPRNESDERRRSSSKKEVKTIEIDGRDSIWSVAFFRDGKHIVSGGKEGRIRRWRIEDGTEVGAPMEAGSTIGNLAVSPDGKWVVNGTGFQRVTVWKAENHSKAKEFKGHDRYVYAIDVSPDATRMATGSADGTVSVWSLPAGSRLLGPSKHGTYVVAVRFSPDGRLIAIAVWGPDFIHICDSQNGHRLVNFSVHVGSSHNQSLAWARDSKQLFVLSSDGDINCLDASTGAVLSKWSISSSNNAKCISLANNGTFIAASAGPSVSFWDTTTHKRIGSVIKHPADVVSMAISANYDIVTGGDKKITLRSLCDVVPLPYYEDMLREQEIQRMKVEKDKLEESFRAQEQDSKRKVVDLENTIQALRNELANSQRAANQKVKTLNETIKSLGSKEKSLNSQIVQLEETVQELRMQLSVSQRTADEKDNLIKSLRALLRAHEQQHHCEALYAQGRIHDAAESLIEIANTGNSEVGTNLRIVDWISEFTHRCVTRLEGIGDEALSSEKHDEALSAYSIALSHGLSSPNAVLVKWVSTMLIRASADEALGAAVKFKLPRFLIYQAICDVLEKDNHVMEAIECFRQMQSELTADTSVHAERAAWELDFQARCARGLEKLGDAAMDSASPDEAVGYYSNALTLSPINVSDILDKRSKSRAAIGSWVEALADADKIIELDPSSYKGYERRHAALHGMGHYGEAFSTFEKMLSQLDQAVDPHVRDLRRQYVDATQTIQTVIEEATRHTPRVLIDTATGRLYDRSQQALSFQRLSIYDEMRSSMVTGLDRARISREVKEYYRYVMFSHKWERGEPLFQAVEHISIYELETSPANIKLRTLCSLMRSFGFHWVWSDTCCINKKDNVVLQESLVAMFTWYHGSALTIVYLRGVLSEHQQSGDLRGSIWNTRAWTYQEYVAAETVQFYTEDWKPYLGLDMFNHKDSPAIISEMEQVSGVSAQELAVLRPGLGRVREKLYLASMRKTTLVEDIAYSLFGIFNVAIPVMYGEGGRAVGRLLEHILTGSGDITILAWTGPAGRYNSCLPMDLTVYSQISPPHIPRLNETAGMDRVVKELRSSVDLSLVVMLYDRLHELPSPLMAASRLRLPGIVFPVTEFVRTSESDPATNSHVYCAKTSTFGDVKIRTADDLTSMQDLCLVYPWIRPLLDQEYQDGVASLDRTARALRLAARLRQPFGALLFTPVSRVEHRRVATDSLIMVQVCKDAPLTELVDNIRTIEVH